MKFLSLLSAHVCYWRSVNRFGVGRSLNPRVINPQIVLRCRSLLWTWGSIVKLLMYHSERGKFWFLSWRLSIQQGIGASSVYLWVQAQKGRLKTTKASLIVGKLLLLGRVKCPHKIIKAFMMNHPQNKEDLTSKSRLLHLLLTKSAQVSR